MNDTVMHVDEFDGDEIWITNMNSTSIATPSASVSTLISQLFICFLLCLPGILLLAAICIRQSIRTELFGVMRMNLATSDLLYITSMFVLVIQSYGYVSIGSFGCQLFFTISYTAELAFTGCMVSIGIETMFNLESNSRKNIVFTVFIWVTALVLTCILLYGIGNGPTLMKFEPYPDYCTDNIMHQAAWVFQIYHFIVYMVLPILVFICLFIISCWSCCKKRKVSQEKLVSFLVSSIFMIVAWFLYTAMAEGMGLSAELIALVRPVICLIYTFAITDTRNSLCWCCKKPEDIEALSLIEQQK